MAHAHNEPNRPGAPSEPARLNGTELDVYPAGAGDSHGHHGHTIVAPSTLVGILVALLGLTLLTVATSQGEKVLMDHFNFIIPHWLNVAVALSIAAVKTALVVLFFMQLKYDNPLNGMIFIFTLITVVFFLGFTMIDLGGRTSIDRFKGEYIVEGGTGNLMLPGRGSAPSRNAPAEKPIADFVAVEASNPEHPLHEYYLKAHSAHPKAPPPATGFPLPKDATTGSTRWQSRPVTGLTLPGFAPANHDGHHDDHHGDHAPADPAAHPEGASGT